MAQALSRLMSTRSLHSSIFSFFSSFLICTGRDPHSHLFCFWFLIVHGALLYNTYNTNTISHAAHVDLHDESMTCQTHARWSGVPHADSSSMEIDPLGIIIVSHINNPISDLVGSSGYLGWAGRWGRSRCRVSRTPLVHSLIACWFGIDDIDIDVDDVLIRAHRAHRAHTDADSLT